LGDLSVPLAGWMGVGVLADGSSVGKPNKGDRPNNLLPERNNMQEKKIRKRTQSVDKKQIIKI
jgi:hypothetical protein